MSFTISRPKSEDLLRARDLQTSREELVRLAAHRDPVVKAAIAARRDCPLASMFALVQESDARVLEALASNASAPRSVVERLAKHKRPAISSLAARRLKFAIPA